MSSKEFEILVQEALGIQDSPNKRDEVARAASLNLHNQGVESLSPETLQALSNLRCLDLSFNRLSSPQGLETVATLKELKLYDNRLKTLEGLTRLTGLVILEVQSNALTSLEGISRLKSLQVLDVSHNAIGTLKHVVSMPALTALRASSIGLTELDGLSNLPKLRELNVALNRLSSLASLASGLRLTELNASSNALTSLVGLRFTAASLDSLTLDSNQISSLDSLGSADFPLLTDLSLAANKIATTAGSWRARCTALESLDLSRNPVATYAALEPLKEVAALQDLALDGSPLLKNEDYRRKVAEILPTLETLDEEPVSAEERGGFSAAGAGTGPADIFTLSEDGPSAEEDEEMRREMQKFMAEKGIKNAEDVLGKTLGASLRPGTASKRPSTASTSGRPSTAQALAGVQAPSAVKDPLMYQRPPTARSGVSSKVLVAEEYESVRDKFVGDMDKYKADLTKILSTLRSALTRDPHQIAEDLRARGAYPGNIPTPSNALPAIPQIAILSTTAPAPAPTAKPPTAAAPLPEARAPAADLDIPIVGARPPTASGRRTSSLLASTSGLPPAPPAAPAPSEGSATAQTAADAKRKEDAFTKALAEIGGGRGQEALALYERLFGPSSSSSPPSTASPFAALPPKPTATKKQPAAAAKPAKPPASKAKAPEPSPEDGPPSDTDDDDEEEDRYVGGADLSNLDGSEMDGDGLGLEDDGEDLGERAVLAGEDEDGYSDLAQSDEEDDLQAIIRASVSGSGLLQGFPDASPDTSLAEDAEGDGCLPLPPPSTPGKKGLGPKLAPLPVTPERAAKPPAALKPSPSRNADRPPIKPVPAPIHNPLLKATSGNRSNRTLLSATPSGQLASSPSLMLAGSRPGSSSDVSRPSSAAAFPTGPSGVLNSGSATLANPRRVSAVNPLSRGSTSGSATAGAAPPSGARRASGTEPRTSRNSRVSNGL